MEFGRFNATTYDSKMGVNSMVKFIIISGISRNDIGGIYSWITALKKIH